MILWADFTKVICCVQDDFEVRIWILFARSTQAATKTTQTDSKNFSVGFELFDCGLLKLDMT